MVFIPNSLDLQKKEFQDILNINTTTAFTKYLGMPMDIDK